MLDILLVTTMISTGVNIWAISELIKYRKATNAYLAERNHPTEAKR